jgi:3'-phosphoadenosine 5'-phosphosulfate sulfotransferase (PAPS reductase)/FAD synthetase
MPTADELKMFQNYPLDLKIAKSILRIRQFYNAMGGAVYISFSGGKDSTVLLHLVRSIYPNVQAVFADTGLEFPEIKQFVKTFDNVEIVRPKMNFRDVISEYGYPVISKAVAQNVKEYKSNPTGENASKLLGTYKNKDGQKSMYCCDKYKFLIEAPFLVSDLCCAKMKKEPLKQYETQSGNRALIGTMAEESIQRQSSWEKYGCNILDGKRPHSNPLSFWLEADIWEYIRINNLDYAEPYKMGYDRTGCVFCMFGAHLEKYPNRFQRLQRTHPKLYDYCMRDWELGGLGLQKVLEYIGVPWEDNQTNLFGGMK